jgi:hypothetical protein
VTLLQPASPIIVRMVGPASDDVGLGEVILGALGLTGAIAVTALVLGIMLGGLFILFRIRHPRNAFNGETADELSMHLT